MNGQTEQFLLENEDVQHGRFLIFSVDEEVYGIEIRHIAEIIGMQPITKLPETPDYVKGIINLRGKIIPVTDARLKFRKDAKEYNDRTCIIVIETSCQSVGLIVDNVAEVINIADDNISLPPDTRSGVQNRYINGIGKLNNAITLLLDCEKLFGEEEEKIITNEAGGF